MKKRLLKWVVKHLFCGITEDDFVQMKKMDKPEQLQLKEEAKYLQAMQLWQQLNKEMKLAANERMFTKSNSTEDMIFGKAMLYTLEVMKTKMNNLEKIK